MSVYGENKYFKLIRCADNQAWLDARRLGIGGSDVAAIIGVSPWASPSEIWLEKTGRGLADSLDNNPTVQFGNMMEQHIGDWFHDTHPNILVRRLNAICQKLDKPHAQASLDFECKDENGVWGILEIKTARSQAMWNDGVPAYYMTQVQHYMYVTNRPYAWFAVFFRDSCQFGAYYVERDDAYIDVIEAAVDKFWEDNVIENVPPEKIVGTTNEAKALMKIVGMPTGSHFKKRTDPQTADLIERYKDAVARAKAADDDKTKYGNQLRTLIGSDKGVMTDTERITWTRSERTTLDSKKVRELHPDVFEECSKTETVSGGLRISELKN